jgi:glutaredoxin
MKVIIAGTKTCRHCPILEKELKKLSVPYLVYRFEDHPEFFAKYKVKHSPLIIVDDEIVFNGMPSIQELEEFFSKKR